MDKNLSVHCVYLCAHIHTEPWLYNTYALWASWYSLKFLANWSVSWCSVQFCHSLMSNSLWPHGPQHAGLPVHHQLLGSTQTHVHWVSDAIQPSHPVSSPSPSALSLSQHWCLFKWVSSSHQVVKVLELQLQHHSSQWTPRTDLL